MELNRGKRGGKKGRGGMVLLLSLSVIMLMSVALMKAFERKSIEVAHLSNNLNRFQAETLSRSIFKLILIGIKEKGLVTIIGNRRLWEGQNFPLDGIDDGYFQIIELKPMDHLFNLNRKITDSNKMARAVEFYNLVTAIRKRTHQDDLGVSQVEVEEALSAIVDFTDIDSEMDTQFMYDHEFYPDENPPFEVKNQLFDRVSEIKILPAVRNLDFTRTRIRRLRSKTNCSIVSRRSKFYPRSETWASSIRTRIKTISGLTLRAPRSTWILTW